MDMLPSVEHSDQYEAYEEQYREMLLFFYPEEAKKDV